MARSSSATLSITMVGSAPSGVHRSKILVVAVETSDVVTMDDVHETCRLHLPPLPDGSESIGSRFLNDMVSSCTKPSTTGIDESASSSTLMWAAVSRLSSAGTAPDSQIMFAPWRVTNVGRGTGDLPQ